MSRKIVDMQRPQGLLRLILRLPTWMYRLHLGRLLGNRFLLLTHIGRKSGLPHRTILEVISYIRETDTYIIASGWAGKADWLRNVQKNPQIRVNVGGRSFEAIAEQLSSEVAEQEVRNYAQRHRIAFRSLAKLLVGHPLSGTDEDYREFVRIIPLVALRRLHTSTSPSPVM